MNLIETAISHKCFDFVFSLNCATYGERDGIMLTEKTPQNRISAYGASKKYVEELIINLSISKGLRYIIFCYFNVAGANLEAEIVDFLRPETHIIQVILDTIIGRHKFFKIFGTDYKINDGTCIRDYVHFSDIAVAHLLGLKWIKSGGANKIYNLGTRHSFFSS